MPQPISPQSIDYIAIAAIAVAFVSSIAATIVSLISLSIAKKNRTNTLRERIHSEQVDAAKKLMTLLTSLEFLLEDIKEEKDTSIRNNMIVELEQERDKFWFTYYESALFLDEKVDDEIAKIFEPIGILITKIDEGGEYSEKDYENGFIEIINILFEMLGVEKLIMENKQAIKRK